jgi:hypothetical protein
LSVALLDTTVFCNIIPVPAFDQHATAVREQLEEFASAGVILILPLAVVVEAGNHVAQCGDGRVRRETAERFARIVRQAVRGQTPFIPTPFFEPHAVLGWLDEFPDSAMREVGFGDLSIVKEFERQCELHPQRHVFIWSLDEHLRGHERAAKEW